MTMWEFFYKMCFGIGLIWVILATISVSIVTFIALSEKYRTWRYERSLNDNKK